MSLLSVEDLQVRFPLRRGTFGATAWLRAVDGISFDVEPGETLSIVGESGSGKTTAALAVARLVGSAGGRVTLDGQDVLGLEGEGLRQMRRKIQVIFQDPYSTGRRRRR